MYGRIATYRFTGDPHEIAQRVEEGLLPIFQSQPGFQAYNITTTGDEIMSMSAWTRWSRPRPPPPPQLTGSRKTSRATSS